ncbi:hypothetical protein ACLOJK_006687 [Asimina triloba]
MIDPTSTPDGSDLHLHFLQPTARCPNLAPSDPVANPFSSHQAENPWHADLLVAVMADPPQSSEQQTGPTFIMDQWPTPGSKPRTSSTVHLEGHGEIQMG